MKIESKKEILKLFKKLGVKYLTDYPILFEPLKNIDLTKTDYYLDNLDEFQRLTNNYGSHIRNRELAPVYIEETENRGYGLFTKETLKEGQYVGIYFGVVREQEEMTTYDETGFGTDYAWDYPDEIPGFPMLEIDAKPEGSEMRFANHDFNSNLRVEHTVVDNCWYIFFVADRDIEAEEELTISYGEAYWDTDYRTLS